MRAAARAVTAAATAVTLTGLALGGGVAASSAWQSAARQPQVRVVSSQVAHPGARPQLHTAPAGTAGTAGWRADVRHHVLGADPWMPLQWGLAAVHAPDVWPVTAGAGITVAVVDTGVAAGHGDLAGRVLPGAQFLDGGSGQSSGDGRVDPHGHGTHVAGIVAASAGNDLDVAGVAPQVSILPVRVLDGTGSGWDSDVAVGIIWAVDHGADVVNLSLGSPEQTPALADAVAYAAAKDVVVVAAAGNTALPCSSGQDPGECGNAASYPAASAGVVSVAAVDPAGQRAWFSTHNAAVDIAAPGVNVVSLKAGGGVVGMSGTSMAAPHVAGVAALLRAAHPAWGREAVEQRLLSTAADLGPSGPDEEFGAGLVDAAAALGVPVSNPTPTLPTPTLPTPTLPTPTLPTPTLPPVDVDPPATIQPVPGDDPVFAGSAVSLTVQPGPVTSGDRVDVQVRLTRTDTTAPVTGPVTLWRRTTSGPWRRTALTVTAANGTAVFRVRVGTATVLQARFAGGDGLLASASPALRVTPRAHVTLTGTKTSGRPVLTVAVRPGGPATVRLQAYTAEGWRTYRVSTVTGRRTLTLTGPTGAAWRAVALARPGVTATGRSAPTLLR